VQHLMDQELILEQCLKGKKEAQQALYDQYAATMLGLCYRYTKSYEDAEDVLQDGFIKVFTHLHQYKKDGDLGAWIRRIMVNTAISYLNRHRRYKKEMTVDDISMHPVSDENPEVSLDTKELIETIRKLPAGYQAVFNMIAVDGYPQTEIAELMDMNINTVRSQYSRARSMLIRILKENNRTVIKDYEGTF